MPHLRLSMRHYIQCCTCNCAPRLASPRVFAVSCLTPLTVSCRRPTQLAPTRALVLVLNCQEQFLGEQNWTLQNHHSTVIAFLTGLFPCVPMCFSLYLSSPLYFLKNILLLFLLCLILEVSSCLFLLIILFSAPFLSFTLNIEVGVFIIFNIMNKICSH